MQAARLATRLQREIRMLESDPPPGVCAWPCDDSLSHLQAQIQGPDETVYAKGLFKLEVRVPERYPFEPPNVKFKTPIYHPNIDSGGRICLDILNMPPKGSWKPSMNIPTVLASIGLLLAEPNPDDGLMGDITAEYKHNRLSFDMTARNWTHKYARQEESASGDEGARNSVAPDNVQQKPSPSVVQSSTEDRTTGPNKFGKCSVVSNSKLTNLGTKLSLEKGSKEVGKQSVDSGAVDVFAVTSKRAFASIENTVGTRQIAVQESPPLKKTLAENVAVGKMGNGSDMRPEPNENSPVVEGSETLGSTAVNSHKLKSSGFSIEFGKFKRPREGRASPPADSSPTSPMQTGCSDTDKLSLPATTSSPEAAELVLQASASTAHKRSVETPEGMSSSSLPKSSTKVAPAHTQEGNSAQPRDEAETFIHGRSSNVGSSYKSIDKYLIRTSVALGPSVQGQDDLVTKSLTDRSGAPSTIGVPTNVHSRVEPESKRCQSAKVDMAIIPDEMDPELKKASESVRHKQVKKPPLPANPITDIIVLDSESDDEPPKGRSRLSLSRRKVVRSNAKIKSISETSAVSSTAL